MTIRKQITAAMIERLAAPKSGRVEIFDSVVPQLTLRITAKGKKSFVVRTRVKGSLESLRLTIGDAKLIPLAEARERASELLRLCARGIDPRTEAEATKIATEQAAADTEALRVENVVAAFMKRHASKNRTAGETQRIFDKYVLPSWKDRVITGITRRDVVALLDQVEDAKIEGMNGRKLGGPVMADRVLAQIRKMMNWHAARDGDFVSPIIQGMSRSNPRERARDRILSDDEIRIIWPLLDSFGTFGGVVKLLFLTAQRREEVAGMDRREIEGDTWVIPKERYKTKVGQAVPLSDAALAVIAAQSKVEESTLVFTTTGTTPFSGFGKARAALDEAILMALRERAVERGDDPEKVEPFAPWVLHDIRRTARSLLSRAGVQPHVAERVLGHVIAGVEGVYDRHSYSDEKRDALEKLAALLDKIINPPAALASNVVQFQPAVAS